MPFFYAYDAIQKIVHARAEGVLAVSDLLDYLDTIIDDENIASGFVELVDMSAVDDLVLGHDGSAPLADTWRRYREKGSAGTIVFAPTDECHGSLQEARATILPPGELEKTPLVIVRTREEIVEELGRIRS